MADTTFDVLARVRADTSNFASGMRQADRAAQGLSDTATTSQKSITGMVARGSMIGTVLGQVAYSGVMRLGSALVGLAKQGIGSAASMEQTKMAFTTMLGSAEKAEAMIGKLRAFAAATPFELPGLLANTKQLMAYGFAAEDVIPMLRTVGDATSALGSGQVGIAYVTRALGQMQAKAKVSGEEMLQLTEQGIPAWRYLAQAMHMSVPAVQELSRKGLIPADKAIKALLAGMKGDFGGNMAKQAKTLGGLMSTLKDEVNNALTDALMPLIPTFGKIVKAMIPVASVAAKVFGAFLSLAGKGLLAILGPLLRLIKYMQSPAFKQFADRVKAAFGGLMASVGRLVPNLRKAWETISGAVMDAWRKVRPGLTQLGGLFMDALKTVIGFAKALWKAIKPLWGSLVDAFTTIGKAIAENFVPLWDSLVALFKAVWPIIKAVGIVLGVVLYAAVWTVVKVLQVMLPIVARVISWVLKLVPPLIKVGAVIITIVVKAVSILLRILFGLISGVAKVVTAVARAVVWLVKKWAAGWSAIWRAVQAAWRWITNAISTAIGAVVDFLKGLWGKAKDLMARFGTAIINGGKKAIDWFKDLPGKVAKWVGALATKLFNLGKDLVRGLWNGLKSMASWIKDKVTGWLKDIIPGPIQRLFGMHSPSKYMVYVGKMLAEGLKKGLFKSKADAVAAMVSFAKSVRDTLVAKLGDALTKAKDRLKSLKAAFRDLVKSTQDSFRDFGTIMAGLGEGPTSARDLVASMKQRVAAARTFASQMKALRKAGLNATSLQEILGAGPVEGGRVAAALLAQGKGAIAEVNRLEAALGKYGRMAGTATAGGVYGRQIARAQADLRTARAELAAAKAVTVKVEKGAVVIGDIGGLSPKEKAELHKMIDDAFGALAKRIAAAKG